MKFGDFEAAAQEAWAQLPGAYKQGVDGLLIERDACTAPAESEVYTLGECLTESYPSAFGGPETTRSTVVLYYGSFLRLSLQDPCFDWSHEIWETLTHELQHHLESLASESGLEDFDYAVEQNFKRLAGESFDPLFYRAGQPLQNQAYQVESDIFLELPLDRATTSGRISFEWAGQAYAVNRPGAFADVTFVELAESPVSGLGFCLVIVAPRTALRLLGDFLRRRPLTVSSSLQQVERLQ